jgi:membrane protein DedA with SNARE-associated domain
MLKKPLIGAGIGLGVLTLCSTLLVVGAVAGGMAGYLGGRYATSPWQVWPEPE